MSDIVCADSSIFSGHMRAISNNYFLLIKDFLIISIGIIRTAKTRHISQGLGVRLSTLSILPPNVTNTNCITKIENITIKKCLFFIMPLNGLMCSVLALKPLNVIAIINVANNADFRYVVSTSPNNDLIGGINRIPRQIMVIYKAPIIISVSISLLTILASLGIGLFLIYSFKAGSLPKAIPQAYPSQD